MIMYILLNKNYELRYMIRKNNYFVKHLQSLNELTQFITKY